MAFAQTEDTSLTDDENEEISVDGNLSDNEKYAMWNDPLYFQFGELMPELARSIGRLDARISALAVTNISFSPNLDNAFRKVAEAKLYGQLLLENPQLKLIKCDECNRITSELKNGILTISRGLKDQEARNELASKLGVQGFMTTMITEEERQLSVVINVHDAQEGRIILSDVITGKPLPKARYWHLYAGHLTIPVMMASGKSVDQTALTFGAEHTIRFAESWIVGFSLAYYTDNNSKLGNNNEDYVELATGYMFDGTIAWELASLMQSNAALAVHAGMGEFISTQFNFSVYYRAGFKLSFGQRLTLNYSLFSFPETHLSKPEDDGTVDKLPGAAALVSFGYQF